MFSIVRVLVAPVLLLLGLVESLLFVLVGWYDAYLYSPLQTTLKPVVEEVPRTVIIRGKLYTVFTANIVSYSRTVLVIPIALTLKYQMYWTGFWCVMLHDFLDHLDGIVAKVHREKYGEVDDPFLGGFMDAFCDKIVNILSLWSILMVTDFTNMTWLQTVVYVSACAIVICYEFTLGVVRVQDFFRAYYYRKFKKIDLTSNKTSTAAVMEGKLKEKLESIAIAALCVAQSNAVVISSVSGILGTTCLFLSIRLAHSSLMSKINAREPQIRSQSHASDDEDEMKNSRIQDMVSKETTNVGAQTEKHTDSSSDEDEKVAEHDGEEKTKSHDLGSSHESCMTLIDSESLDPRAELVYTIGCFDLFHYGHIKLIKQMRTFGKKVVVGVHDSRSIYQLKHRVPVDSTLTRMRNVKQYADEVFCVAGTDPTPFIEYIFDKRTHKSSAIYVRGDDMPQFPARSLCEKLMTVKFLPYTTGVSTTKLRKDLLNSNYSDVTMNDRLDHIMLY